MWTFYAFCHGQTVGTFTFTDLEVARRAWDELSQVFISLSARP